jgi:glucan phosphorylase
MKQVNEILEERGSRYGDFNKLSRLSQSIKDVYYINQKENVTPAMSEAIEMIIHKLARIINGDPYYKDNFIDIQGYCQLYLDELNRIEKEKADEVLK